ncbi:sodium-dependent transporter [Thermaurantiacus sp.]
MTTTAPIAHGHWSSRLTFLLATIGLSVGLGNVWRFPWLAGENGGGAFVLIYLGCVAFVALPIIMAELVIGRRGGMTPAASFLKLARAEGASPAWRWGGIVAIAAAFLISSFYGVIGGWTLAYSWFAASGQMDGLTTTSAGALFDGLLASPAKLSFWMALFLLANILVVVRGVESGVEKATSVLMPILFALLAFLCVYALVVGDAQRGMAFLFQPDWSKVSAQTFVRALGQAFFSVSVGMAAMILYGAYLPKTVQIAPTAALVAGADTLVAILAGIAIFPFVFAQGLAPASGPGLVFIILPVALQGLAAPSLIAFVFFILLAIAALTSMVALFELMAALGEEQGWPRGRTVWLTGGAMAGLGLLTVFSFNSLSDVHPLGFVPAFAKATFFDLIDWFTSNLGLTIGALTSALFAGWVMKPASTASELGVPEQHPGYRLWAVLIRWPVPITIIILIAAALLGLGETVG